MLTGPQIKQKIAQYLAKAKVVFSEVFVPHEENNFLPKALKSKYLFWYGAGLLIVKIALISLVLILPSTDFFSTIAVQRLVSLVNQERQARNLPVLSLNNSLNSVADLKVNDMLARDYFEHTSPAGITPWFWFKKIGYNYQYAGENLAMGFTQTDDVFQAWMNSPLHRDNILNPNYQEMGLAIKSGQIQNHEDTLAVLVFGRPAAERSSAEVVRSSPLRSPSGLAPEGRTISAAGRPKTPAASVASESKNTASPDAILQVTPSQAPIALAEQIKLETALNEQQVKQNNINSLTVPTNKIGYAPRVLGAFVSKSDEIFKTLYLYFTLFLAIALMVNIFVKIRIQYWPTIIATTLIIALSSVLIFI